VGSATFTKVVSRLIANEASSRAIRRSGLDRTGVIVEDYNGMV
jgi:hypothetical protein